MNRTQLTKYLAGTGVATGILSSGSAHAQLMYQSFTNETITGTSLPGGSAYISFDLDPIQVNTDSLQEFNINTSGVAVTGPKIGGNSTENEEGEVTASAVAFGTSIGAESTFALFTGVSDGADQYYGLSLNEPSGLHYGYVEFSQSTDSTTGEVTESIEALAVQEQPNVSITAGATPEPTTTSLLAFGALGAAGLMAYRRRVAA